MFPLRHSLKSQRCTDARHVVSDNAFVPLSTSNAAMEISFLPAKSAWYSLLRTGYAMGIEFADSSRS
jgi:hypothetical protein